MKVTGSKNIAAIDHGDDGLTVEFQNGRKYRYPDVDVNVYEALVEQVQSTDPEASVGKTFNALVRSAGFAYVEVTQ